MPVIRNKQHTMKSLFTSVILLFTVIAGCGDPKSAQTSPLASEPATKSQEPSVVPVQLAQNSDTVKRNVQLQPIFSFMETSLTGKLKTSVKRTKCIVRTFRSLDGSEIPG